MARFSLLTLLAVISFRQATAQCPNEVAHLHPNDRTMSVNNTWFLVPVPLDSVRTALTEAFGPSAFNPLAGPNRLSLLPLPASLNFPAGTHPVFVSIGLDNDIRQSDLQIDGPLLGSATIVPFVGKGGSSTPFNAPLIAYLAGTNAASNAYLAGLILTTVATLVGGIFSRIGAFLPNKAAYQSNNNGLLSANSKWALAPNQGSGPGIYPEVLDFLFSKTTTSTLSLRDWESVVNQPYLLNGLLAGRCQRNTYYFNAGTAQVEFRAGRVIFGPAAGVDRVAATLQKSARAGVYEGVQGFSACAQLVGYGPLVGLGEDCKETARKVAQDMDVL